jgi:hypothetical protein
VISREEEALMMLKWLCVPLAILAAAPVFAQQTIPPPVVVRFHVVKGDQLVTTLTRDDFFLLEDGVPRKISEFWGGQTQAPKPPVELIFLLDSTIPYDRNDPRGPDSPVLDIAALGNMIAEAGAEHSRHGLRLPLRIEAFLPSHARS